MGLSEEYAALLREREAVEARNELTGRLLRCPGLDCWNAAAWTGDGPQHSRLLQLKGTEDQWLLVRAEIASMRWRPPEEWRRDREDFGETAAPGPAREPEPFDPEAYAEAVARWLFDDQSVGSCVRRELNPHPPSPWPSFDERLARGDFSRRWAVDADDPEEGHLAGKWGTSCCSWDEAEGCPWYPRPRCSLATHEVVQPPCRWGTLAADGTVRFRGPDWDEAEVRRVFEASCESRAYCLDREGFLWPGRSCEGCASLEEPLFSVMEELDPASLEEVC